MFVGFVILFFIIFIFFMVVGLWLGWSTLKGFLVQREKSSSFECGYDPKDNSRTTFSLRFFMVIILFIVFDIELCYLLNIPYQFFDGFYKSFLIFIGFFIILLVGTLEEWRRGVFNWKET